MTAAASEDLRIEVGGATVHYLRAGDSPRHLLLLHGSGADSAHLSYQDLVPALAADFTVLAPDFPGYGQSAGSPHAHSTEGLIAFVVAFLDALGIDQVDVAGLSMGGGVALGFALEHPDRVRRVVLMGSHGTARRSVAGFYGGVMARLPAWVYGWSWRYAAATSRRTRKTMRRVWGDQTLLDDVLLQDIRQQLARPDAWRVVRTWSRSEARLLRLRTCYLDQLANLHRPVLLVHGGKDRLVPLSGARAAASLLPDARLLILPGCGHWIPRECPSELIEALESFLLPTDLKELS